MSTTSKILATLSNGFVLPLREYLSSYGNTCHGILGEKKNGERYFSVFGVFVTENVTGKVESIKDVTVEGVTFPVTSKMEAKQDKQGNAIPNTERLVLRAGGAVLVKGRQKEFSFRLTPGADGTHNISASINGKRGKGSSPKGVDTL